jgi:hypothetical protein
MNAVKINTVTPLDTVYNVQTVHTTSGRTKLLTHAVRSNLCSVEGVCQGEYLAECTLIHLQFYFLWYSLVRSLCLCIILLGTYDCVHGCISDGKQVGRIILATLNQSTCMPAPFSCKTYWTLQIQSQISDHDSTLEVKYTVLEVLPITVSSRT